MLKAFPSNLPHSPNSHPQSRRPLRFQAGPIRRFNVVVLGAGGVGKSALTVRYIRGVFVEHYDPTIEDQYTRMVEVSGELSSLEIVDTAGAEQFTSLCEVYIKSGLGFVLVFSLTHEATLTEVDSIRQQICSIKGGDNGVPMVVVGTKLDLVNEREVQRSTIEQLSSHWKIPFYETSAKRDWYVSDVFEGLIKQMRARYPEDPVPKKKWLSNGCIIS